MLVWKIQRVSILYKYVKVIIKTEEYAEVTIMNKFAIISLRIKDIKIFDIIMNF